MIWPLADLFLYADKKKEKKQREKISVDNSCRMDLEIGQSTGNS